MSEVIESEGPPAVAKVVRKRAQPPPVDYLKVAPYTRNDVAFHLTGGILAGLLVSGAVVWLAAGWSQHRPPAWALILSVLLGVYLADLVSGILHWAFDTWFSEDLTFIRRMVIMVREHHIYPQRIFQFPWYHDAGTLSWIALVVTGAPVLAAVAFAGEHSPFAYCLVLTAVVFDVLLVTMLEFHKCGHRPKVPGWVRLLQRAGLLLSHRHHMRHHSGNHDVNYCLITGWADDTLGRLGFFRALEGLIERRTGAVPQHNDHEWLRRYGRPVVGRGGAARGGAGRAA